MADLSKHFFDDGTCKIHTYRQGKCPLAPCDYRTAVAKPFPETPDEAHHILCVSAAIAYKDRYKDPELSAIDGAYRNTSWCVNKAPNMIWLPLKRTYSQNAAGDTDAAVWRLNLPCHDQDHNCAMGYTDEVISKMKEMVWDPIRDSQQADPPDCPTEADVQAMFQGVYDHFRAELIDRGMRNDGTKAARKMEGQPYWWLPFSMANDNVARNRRVTTFGSKPRWARGFVRVRP